MALTTPATDATTKIIDSTITDRYALYNADCCDVLPTLPSNSIHGVIYSPPFPKESGGALYAYSSSPRDFSNSRTYEEFFEHYDFLVRELARVTMPGRINAVHCMDIPKDGANLCGSIDFPGDVIRLHQKHGFEYLPRISIWKEPLSVRNRTMAKSLAHRQIVEDATLTTVAASDYLLPFRKIGANPIPVTHPTGFDRYIGERDIPPELIRFRNWGGNQIENRYSHWIWRHYASSFWDDIRINRVLPYREAKDPEDEKHPHPLQLDVIERFVLMYTNPGEVILTPYAGVGSEVCGPIANGRRGIGIELKSVYYRHAVKNCENTINNGLPRGDDEELTPSLFDDEAAGGHDA